MTKLIAIFGVFLILWVPQLSVAQSSNILSNLYACETINEKTSQLECFLTETEKLRKAETAGSFLAIDKNVAANIEKESFGFNIPSLPSLGFLKKTGENKTKPLKERSIAIISVSTGYKGYLRFTLENGQVWQQTQPAKVRHLGKADPDILVIRTAALGSFLARVNGKGPKVRVRRVK